MTEEKPAGEAAAVQRYQDARASGLSDHEARAEGWPEVGTREWADAEAERCELDDAPGWFAVRLFDPTVAWASINLVNVESVAVDHAHQQGPGKEWSVSASRAAGGLLEIECGPYATRDHAEAVARAILRRSCGYLPMLTTGGHS